jgi:hypothetical protein
MANQLYEYQQPLGSNLCKEELAIAQPSLEKDQNVTILRPCSSRTISFADSRIKQRFQFILLQDLEIELES